MNPFARRRPPPTPASSAERLALAAQTAADAAHKIARVAEQQAAIIGAQADEIARLRRQLAEARQEAERATQAAGYWYRQANTLAENARRDLPAVIARNLSAYARRN